MQPPFAQKRPMPTVQNANQQNSLMKDVMRMQFDKIIPKGKQVPMRHPIKIQEER